MTDDNDTRHGGEPPRLALDDPATLAWGARLLQAAMERRRRRLAEQAEAGPSDESAR
jgi:hypothetical protein